MSSLIKLRSDERWTIARLPFATADKKRRSTGPASTATGLDVFPGHFLRDGVTIADAAEAREKQVRRGEIVVSPLVVETDAENNALYLVAAQHESGAWTFHPPSSDIQRRSAANRTVRFELVPRQTPSALQRRGFISKAVKLVLLKIANRVVRAVGVPAFKLLETSLWRDNPLGFVHVTKGGLQRQRLNAVNSFRAGPSGRALLLLHGTFSNTVGAFKGLEKTDFFERVAPLYRDQIFGFDHFTFSSTPLENAKDLLAALPNSSLRFDVITHSRGGLVLRNLVECSEDLEANKRFNLGHAVMLASPNEGTPLATPTRWQETIGWFANLIELFPENPFTTASGWVADGLVWLAGNAIAVMPGLAAMDAAGDQISRLQEQPGPPGDCYSAITSNYYPTDRQIAAFLDMGIDNFFGGANDLVVPTEAGWRIDASIDSIPGSRVAVYGPGGNLSSGGGAVHHLNIVTQAETINFVVRALNKEKHPLESLDVNIQLPTGHARRRLIAATSRTAIAQAPAPTDHEGPQAAPQSTLRPASLPDAYSDALHIMVVESPAVLSLPAKNGELDQRQEQRSSRRNRSAQSEDEAPLLIATYGGARVVVPFPLRKGDAGRRSQHIIARNEQIKAYVDGKPGATLPSGAELLQFGTELFEWMFPAEVRPLYDVARTMERKGRLNVIFTSMIPWVAEKPLEFAYDPLRKTFLATEEIHFTRNVLTAVPADRLLPSGGALQILVVVAQPIGTGALSNEQERQVIERGFAPLIETGLVKVDVLSGATPARLHGWVMSNSYDVVHFIGHGEWKDDEGHLVFEDAHKNAVSVPVRTTREILCSRGIKLIFLNACDTGRGGYADFNSGIAQALVAGGVPAVVANQFKVLDPSATAFAQHFYWSLAQGLSIGAAAREARIAVNYSISGESIDWAVPVVYARDPDGSLCPDRRQPPDVLETPNTTRRARRSVEGHKWRVAVWDVNYVFPGINTTLDVMNAAQTRFGFQLVDTSAPVGTWQYNKAQGAKENKIELNAYHAARKLRNKPAELGVDYFICITDKLIFQDAEKAPGVRESKESGIYAWWKEDTDPPDLPENICMFATVGEDPHTGRSADRSIANAVVAMLVAMLSHVEVHGGSSAQKKACPLYEWVETESMANAQKFCFDCKAKLAGKTLPKDDFEALDKLLRVFDE